MVYSEGVLAHSLTCFRLCINAYRTALLRQQRSGPSEPAWRGVSVVLVAVRCDDIRLTLQAKKLHRGLLSAYCCFPLLYNEQMASSALVYC